MRVNPFRRLRRLLVRLLVLSARPLPGDREAIWSVPSAFQIFYFVLFIGVCVPMIADIVQEARAARPEAGWLLLARKSASEFATAGVGAAIGALIAVQGGTLPVFLYQFIVKRFTGIVIETDRAEGEDTPATESPQEWREWNSRRIEAEAEGQPFDEPPPDHRSREEPQS